MDVSGSLLACEPLINLKPSVEKLNPWLRFLTDSDGANKREASHMNGFTMAAGVCSSQWSLVCGYESTPSNKEWAVKEPAYCGS